MSRQGTFGERNGQGLCWAVSNSLGRQGRAILCVYRERTAGWEVHCGAADLAFRMRPPRDGGSAPARGKASVSGGRPWPHLSHSTFHELGLNAARDLTGATGMRVVPPRCRRPTAEICPCTPSARLLVPSTSDELTEEKADTPGPGGGRSGRPPCNGPASGQLSPHRGLLSVSVLARQRGRAGRSRHRQRERQPRALPRGQVAA